MKHLRIAFGLVVVAGLMAVVASPAMAASPIWVTCEKSATGKFNNSKCTEAGSGWETKAVAETREVTSSGTLTLEDMGAPLGGTAIECSGMNLGTIGAGGSDSVRSITATSCKFIKAGGCNSSAAVTAEARNLGWTTKLEEVGKEVRDSIRSLIAGKEPGWAVTCTSILGKKEVDECTGNTSTKIENGTGANAGAVIATFDAASNTPMANCTIGGKEQGLVTGTVINRLRNPSGELQAYWVLATAFGT